MLQMASRAGDGDMPSRADGPARVSSHPEPIAASASGAASRYGQGARPNIAAIAAILLVHAALIGAVLFGLSAPDGAMLASSDTGLPQVTGAGGAIALIPSALFFFILINVFLAFFNLLPIPPFDGSHIVEGLLPRSWAVYWNKLQQVGMILFVVLIAVVWVFPDTGIISNPIGPPVEWMLDQFLRLADWVAG